MILEFNDRESVLCCKKENAIKVTSRFMSGKLIMFAKLSLKSFIYSLTEMFCFPFSTVQAITDTDSTSLQFIIISDPNTDIPEPKMRGIIFEVIIATKMCNRFDTSHPFWDNFQAKEKSRQKQLGLYETEHIDNPCYVTVAVNPKEYVEFFKN